MIASQHSQYERPSRVLAPALNAVTGDAMIVEAAERRNRKTEW